MKSTASPHCGPFPIFLQYVRNEEYLYLFYYIKIHIDEPQVISSIYEGNKVLY